MEHQKAFFESTAIVRLLRGGNRCLGGESMIYDPVRMAFLRIDQIDSDFHVYSLNPETGRLEAKRASKPFIKAHGELYLVELSDGETMVTTLEHRVLDSQGHWVSVGEAYDKQIALASGFRISSSGCKPKAPNCQPASLSPELQSHQACDETRVRQATCTCPASQGQSALRQSTEAVAAKRLRNSLVFLLSPLFRFARALVKARLLAASVFSSPARSWPFHPRSSSGTCQQGLLPGGLRLCETPGGFLADCQSGLHLCGELPRLFQGACQSSALQQDDARVHSHTCLREDGLGSEQEYIRSCRGSCRPSSLDVFYQTLDRGDARLSTTVSFDEESYSRQPQTPSCIGQLSGRHRSTPCEDSPRSEAWSESEFLASHPREFVVDGGNTVKIISVDFLRVDSIYDIEVEKYANYLMSGVVSANSGKSVNSFIELARAARGLDPFNKFPKNRPLLIYVIGRDADYIGRVAYRLLFKPGAIKIILDEKTGKWRSFRPWAEDKDRTHEAMDAPPFIPPECIDPKGWAFENKAERVFSVCRLHFGEGHPMNGTEIRAFGSRSEPAMGDPVDIVVIDEDIDNEAWAVEMEARLSDRKGRMWWAACPQLQNNAMTRISRRAEEQRNLENRTTEEFILSFTDNKFIDDETKQARYMSWSPEERRARDLGEYVEESVLCYPEYSRSVHCLPKLGEHETDPIEDALAKCNYKIPNDWTRWMSVDPGHSVCAVLFAAIPPPDIGDYLVVYDMLYLRGCSARMFGEAVDRRTEGQNFEGFVIDDHGSRGTQAGAGVTIRSQYVEALRDHDIESNLTQSGFFLGTDDVQGRMALLRHWLADRPLYGPKIRILSAKCYDLMEEFPKFKKRISFGRQAVDQPIPMYNHAINCLEYLVARKPTYAPPKVSAKVNPVYGRYQNMIKKQGRGSVNLGPPVPDAKAR